MANIYNSTEKISFKRTTFNCPFQNLLTLNMGDLVPIFCKETLPGDRFSIASSAFLRFAPMLSPVMSDLKIAVHFWFVPNRIIYKDWDDFLTEKNAEAVLPYITKESISRGSLLDYLGYPANTLSYSQGVFSEHPNISTAVKMSALPIRAYNLIYNHWYRDEDLQDEISISLEGGEDITTAQNLLKRAWKKDYFTSARPQAQFGDGVKIPLGDSAPVVGNGKALGLTNGTVDFGLRNDYINSTSYSYISPSQNAYGSDVGSDSSTNYTNGKSIGLTDDSDNSGVVADLSNASAIDVYKLRLAGKMQQLLERKNRVGNRINEYIQAFYGVKPSDGRLQLPEFLGGSVSNAVISEIVQTSESTQTSPQGNLAGHGVGLNSGFQVKNRFIPDHGWIIGLMNVQPSPSYCQGVPRQLTRETPYDFGLPIFQNIGEQDILDKEIYGASETPDQVWGHAPRYAEYKSYNNEFHGDFLGHSSDWHTGRIFDDKPELNEDFVECNPTSRIFDNSDNLNDNKLKAKVSFNVSINRPFTYWSDPGIVKF